MTDPIETLGLIAARADIDAIHALTDRDRLDCETRARAYRRVQLEMLAAQPAPEPYRKMAREIIAEMESHQ